MLIYDDKDDVFYEKASLFIDYNIYKCFDLNDVDVNFDIMNTINNKYIQIIKENIYSWVSKNYIYYSNCKEYLCFDNFIL